MFQPVVNPSLLESIDPYFDPDLFVLGTVAELYLRVLLKRPLLTLLRMVPRLITKPTSSNVEALKKEYEDENKATSKFGLPVGQEYFESLREKAVPQTT